MARKKQKTIASTKKTEKEEKKLKENNKKNPKKGIRGAFSKFKKSPTEKKEKTAKVKKVKKAKASAQQSSKKRQKIRGGILILIGLATIIFVGYFLFSTLFRPQSLADLLPAEKTVAVLEVNIDGSHGQVNQFYDLLKKYPIYNKENVISMINLALPVDYNNQLEPWVGRKMGLGLYNLEGPSPFTPIFFIESKDHHFTTEFLKTRALSQADEELIVSKHNDHEIYEFPFSQNLTLTYINNYLVATQSKEIMQKFLNEYDSLSSRLSEDENYRKVANNLPQGGLVFGYVNLHKLFTGLEQDSEFIAQKGQDLLAMRPFINVFKAEGLTVFAEGDRLVAQTFTSIDNESLDGENYITFSEKYQGELLSLAAQEPIFLAGGHDLTKELNRVEDIFKSGTKTPALVFEGLVEAQKQKYFGKDINLKSDIYPLFTGEYLLTVENSFENPVVSIFLELDNVGVNVDKLDKVVNEFIEVSGIFSPKIQEVELPDGTTGKEIIASPEKIDKGSGTYKGRSYTSLKLGETGIAIHYTILDDIVAMSSSEKSLKLIIDKNEDPSVANMTTSKYFSRNINPILRTADQVVHVKLGALTQILGLNDEKSLAPFLVPFNNFTITKNFFDDGISTIYLVEVI